MRLITDGGVTQETSIGSPSTHILLLTDGKSPGHDGTEVQLNYPPQQLTIYDMCTGLAGEAGTCVTQSTTTELTQVTQGEEERELKSGNEQSIGTIVSLPEHISDRGKSNEGPVDIALRTMPDARHLESGNCRRITTRQCRKPSNHNLLSILGSGLGRPGGPSTHTLLGARANENLTGDGSGGAPEYQSALHRHIALQLGTGLGGETSTGGESSTTANIQETQPAVEASSHRTQPQQTLAKKVSKGKKGPQNE